MHDTSVVVRNTIQLHLLRTQFFILISSCKECYTLNYLETIHPAVYSFLQLLFSRAPKSTVTQSSRSGRDTSCSNPIACISSWATVPTAMQSGVCRLTKFKLLSRFRPMYDQQPVLLLLMVINCVSVVWGTKRTQVELANWVIAAWMIGTCNEPEIGNEDC